jgi:hypothetical protein
LPGLSSVIGPTPAARLIRGVVAVAVAAEAAAGPYRHHM